MQIFLTACYFLLFLHIQKAQYKQLCEMDAKQFVQIESKSLMQEEVNRMMREVIENYTKSKQNTKRKPRIENVVLRFDPSDKNTDFRNEDAAGIYRR